MRVLVSQHSSTPQGSSSCLDAAANAHSPAFARSTGQAQPLHIPAYLRRVQQGLRLGQHSQTLCGVRFLLRLSSWASADDRTDCSEVFVYRLTGKQPLVQKISRCWPNLLQLPQRYGFPYLSILMARIKCIEIKTFNDFSPSPKCTAFY